jgi:hypothetical protein
VADLATLQRQFVDRVTGRAGAFPEGLVASGDLDIYTRMYASRLIDALADDYPKLRIALGEDAFIAAAEAYLRDHPPHSFTLREAGVGLAAHLRADAEAPPWAADLAALERARLEVFDGPDATPLAQDTAIALGAELPELVLAWVPSSVVVPIGWAVDDLWSAIEDDQPAFEPAAEPRVVLVWRRDISVLHRTLDPDEAELAPAIAAGARFAELCEVLGAAHGEAAGERAAELLLRWIAAEAIVAPAP